MSTQPLANFSPVYGNELSDWAPALEAVRSAILTSSGVYFDFLNPDPAMVFQTDIAHALSNLCRFTGHTRRFYSVAQHSVMVSYLVPPEDALAGLLHDAPEAYINDIAKPLKRLLPDYAEIEARVEKVVLGTFGIDRLPESVKKADLVMLATERRDLMPHNNDEWHLIKGIVPLVTPIIPVGPDEAKAMFMKRWSDIGMETFERINHG